MCLVWLWCCKRPVFIWSRPFGELLLRPIFYCCFQVNSSFCPSWTFQIMNLLTCQMSLNFKKQSSLGARIAVKREASWSRSAAPIPHMASERNTHFLRKVLVVVIRLKTPIRDVEGSNHPQSRCSTANRSLLHPMQFSASAWFAAFQRIILIIFICFWRVRRVLLALVQCPHTVVKSCPLWVWLLLCRSLFPWPHFALAFTKWKNQECEMKQRCGRFICAMFTSFSSFLWLIDCKWPSFGHGFESRLPQFLRLRWTRDIFRPKGRMSLSPADWCLWLRINDRWFPQAKKRKTWGSFGYKSFTLLAKWSLSNFSHPQNARHEKTTGNLVV